MGEDLENSAAERETLQYIIEETTKFLDETSRKAKEYLALIKGFRSSSKDDKKLYYMRIYVKLKARREEALQRLNSAKRLLKRLEEGE